MEAGAESPRRRLSKAISAHGLPWHVRRARVEFICAPGPLANGAEAAHAHVPEVEARCCTPRFNRGTLIAPFHNMMLVSPATSRRQVDRLVAAFTDILDELAAP
ncbi:MAG: hypothetical protein R3D80_10620 [Paracoccaceae bacterium]